MRICFDMDGTIADLYGVNNWLEFLQKGDTLPYEVAKPLLRLSSLARRLNNLQKNGYEIVVISWLAKGSDENYQNLVKAAKMQWLRKHLNSVKWNEIYIVPYGTPKEQFCYSDLDILFDDEEQNRNSWAGSAYDADSIIDILKSLAY